MSRRKYSLNAVEMNENFAKNVALGLSVTVDVAHEMPLVNTIASGFFFLFPCCGGSSSSHGKTSVLRTRPPSPSRSRGDRYHDADISDGVKESMDAER